VKITFPSSPREKSGTPRRVLISIRSLKRERLLVLPQPDHGVRVLHHGSLVALVIQMACTHTAAMAVLGRLGGGHGPDRSVATMASAASRLSRTYATQVEALRRLRNGGSQFVRVEHVHVNEGGQAVIGNVKAPD
jgi:hypothetical protein